MRCVCAALFIALLTVTTAHGAPDDASDNTATQPAQTQPAQTQRAQTQPAQQGPFYPVTQFELRYVRDHPDLPPIDALQQQKLNELDIELGRTDAGRIVAPEAGDETMTVTLGELASDEARLYSAQALQRIFEALLDSVPWRGTNVAPDPNDISLDGRDVRPPGQDTLHIAVTVGRITELRTEAAGERIDSDERMNHPLHERIRDRSPLRPAEPDEDEPGDLIEPDVLNEYVFHLSRHPGRRVDSVLSPGEEVAGTTLDYIITENKPWSAYAQLANTGTDQTDNLRQQFGFFHNQLTNNDDIFSIEYSTAGFDEFHAVNTSYEAPLFDAERVRWRAHALWSEFTASDIGFFNDTFTGTTFDYGGSITANVYQDNNLFVDLFAGARMLDVEVDNTIPFTERGREQFFLPHVGVQLEHQSEWYRNYDRVELEWHTPGVTNVDDMELDSLGRTSPDKRWAVLSWNMSHSVFIEPLVNREAWEDPTTPASSTLAHELFGRFRGQHAFGSRLIPQLEQVAGGLYTVRGYPESATAGDTVLLGNFEYRFHIPRAFPVEQEPREMFGEDFRYARQYVYGAPDWDFAPRVFLDVGRVINNSNEGSGHVPDETLVGTGVGFDLAYKRNVRMKLDLGVALDSLENGETDSGDGRLHFVITVLY